MKFFTNLAKSKEKRKQYNKLVWLVAFITFVVGLLIFYKIKLDEIKLLENGLKQDFVVVNKYKKGMSGKYSIYSFSIELDRFNKKVKKPLYIKKNPETLNTFDKATNELFVDLFGKQRYGIERHFNSFKVDYITPKTFSTIQINEIVTLVYLKGEMNKGRLLRELL